MLIAIKRYQQRLFFSLLLFLCFTSSNLRATEQLMLEPIVQGLVLDEPINVLHYEDKYYVEFEELASVTGIKLDVNETLSGYFIDSANSFEINREKLKKKDYIIKNGQIYFSTGFYEKLLPIKFKINSFDMQIAIESDKKLPSVIKAENYERRADIKTPEVDEFQNYKFDERFFSFPITDISYTKGVSKNYHEHNDFNAYQIDISMLAFGLDTSMIIFDTKDPFRKDSTKFRLLAERIFLEEPHNELKLVQFQMGDLSGIQSTLFDNANNGRGVYMSSFKDLVISADKTIDISGPLSAGWDVELYLNEQLISYRQNGIGGRYNFINIPVSYGLNVFKLIFYGPYGEKKEEEKRYYSGTSPVKTREFGYDISLYQRDRFLIEENEDIFNKTNNVNFNSMFYYGLTDNLTLIAGQARAIDRYSENKIRNFSNIGLQTVLSGASVQYNALYSHDNKEFGHHGDVQGNIYIGDIFARYEYYGDLKSPLSFYNGFYMKDLIEARLSGNLYKINIPYYTSFQVMNSHDKETYREIRVRLSPSFWRYYNLTIEQVWQTSIYNRFHYTEVLFNAQFGELGLNAHAQYYTDPESQLNNFGAKLDYRLDRHTYFTFDWTHYEKLQNKKIFYYLDEYSYLLDDKSFDVFKISAGKIFDFGGLTLSLSADTNDNYSAYITYNISIGKLPDKGSIFTNAQTKMTEHGTLMARVKDEKAEPVKNAKIWVTGTEKQVKTNENGEALVTDIQPYEKAIISIFMDEIEDISLYPDVEKYKMVFRPGTVRPFDIKLSHKGAVEGQLDLKEEAQRYKVKMISNNYEQTTYSDSEGFFIFNDTVYGEYEIKIYDKDENLVGVEIVNINNPLVTINKKIKILSATSHLG